MKKVLYYKILSTFVLITLLLLNIAPFSISAAQSGSGPILGINVYYEDMNSTYVMNRGDLSSARFYCSRTYNNVCTLYEGPLNLDSYITFSGNTARYGIFKYEFVLDNSYVGYINISYTVSGVNKSDTIYVNGNKAEYNILTESVNSSGTAIPNITISSYSLNLTGETVWRYPIESYPFINGVLRYKQPFYEGTRGDYIYPMFSLSANDQYFFSYVHPNATYTMIMAVNFNMYNQNQFLTYFDFTNLTVTEYRIIANWGIQNDSLNTTQWYLINVKFKPNAEYNYNFKTLKACRIIPVYFIDSRFNNPISTDFAVNFGLSNEYLDSIYSINENLNSLVNGNNQSNNSVNTANNTNQSLSSEGQKVENIENQLVSDFDSSMNNITVDSPLNILGSGFVQSANWVRTQFDTLTTNTPFGTLITFSLILGIGLLIIGKVLG